MTPDDIAITEAGAEVELVPATAGHAVEPDSGVDLRGLLEALQAVRIGDFSVRLPANQGGEAGRIADAFNDIVGANERMAKQLEHVGEVVGRQGKTRTRVRFGLSHGQHPDR
jgi:methyl-accepting chemotaxis protein